MSKSIPNAITRRPTGVKVTKVTVLGWRQTLFCLEIAESRANVLPLLSTWIQNLHITRHVSISVILCKLQVVQVGYLCIPQLMIPNREQIIINLFKYRNRQIPVWLRKVTQSRPIMQILKIVSSLRVGSRIDISTPVSTRRRSTPSDLALRFIASAKLTKSPQSAP
jgi:hypothetical protein